LKRWILYHFLAIFIVSIPTIGVLGFLLHDSRGYDDSMRALQLIYELQIWMLVVIPAIQFFLLIRNASKKGLVKHKVLFAITNVYSFVFFGLYISTVLTMCKMKEIAAGRPESTVKTEIIDQNSFLGSHTFFIIPVLLQTILFVVLLRKKSPTQIHEKKE